MDTAQIVGLVFTGLATLASLIVAIIGVAKYRRKSHKHVAEVTSVQPQTAVPVTVNPTIINQVSPNFILPPGITEVSQQQSSASAIRRDAPRLEPTAKPSVATRTAEAVTKQSASKEDIRREVVKNALAAANGLTTFVHAFAKEYTRTSRSQSQYSKQLVALQALRMAFGEKYQNQKNLDLVKVLSNLDSALGKLELTWLGADPRDILMTYMDPFASTSTTRSIESLISTFTFEAERIARAIAKEGYEVMQQKPYGQSYVIYFLSSSTSDGRHASQTEESQ